MNVIGESQPGDEVTIFQEFNASPHGQPFSWKTSRRFLVGEQVRYVSFYQDQHAKDIPGLGWMVLFDAADGKRYAASQTYFMTDECWQDLKKFFTEQSPQRPRRKKKVPTR